MYAMYVHICMYESHRTSSNVRVFVWVCMCIVSTYATNIHVHEETKVQHNETHGLHRYRRRRHRRCATKHRPITLTCARLVFCCLSHSLSRQCCHVATVL